MIDFNKLYLYRENNRIEAKRAQGGLPQSIWETYSAFANTLGGVILLGVAELTDKSFQSVPLADPRGLTEEFWRLLSGGSQVSVNLLSRDDIHIEESGENRIVVIEVPRADRRDRPVYLGPSPFLGSYRRSGEGDYRCSREEVLGMLRDQADQSQDRKVIADIELTDLNKDSIIRFHAALSGVSSDELLIRMDLPEFLRELGAAASASNGVLHPTAAGLLMFGQYEDILRHFPGFSLRCGEAASLNLFDFYTGACDALSRSLPEDSDSPAIRQAIREAVSNALIHADYLETPGIGLSVTRTKTELLITNPGSFRVNAAEAVRENISDPRNAVLSKMFSLILPRVEGKRGLSAVVSAWEQHGWASPCIREEFNPERTTLVLPLNAADSAQKDVPLRAALRHLPLSRDIRKQQIAGLLTSSPSCTLGEICGALSLGESRVRTLLSQMITDGLVVAEKSGKSKYYRLKA